MDCSAYVSEKLFKQLLGDCGISGICEVFFSTFFFPFFFLFVCLFVCLFGWLVVLFFFLSYSHLFLLKAREERYDIVVHLVTAAHGKESFYGTDSNNVRSEPPDLARELDSKVLKV